MSYRVEKDAVYRGIVKLSGLASWASNSTVLNELQGQGLLDVTVWGDANDLPADWPTSRRACEGTCKWVQGRPRETATIPSSGSGWEITALWKYRDAPGTVQPTPPGGGGTPPGGGGTPPGGGGTPPGGGNLPAPPGGGGDTPPVPPDTPPEEQVPDEPVGRLMMSKCNQKVALVQRDDGRLTIKGTVPTRNDWPEAINQWRDLIKRKAAEYGVPEAVIAAIIYVESKGNPNAASSCCHGLMQLHHLYFGGNEGGRLYDPELNVDLGTKRLAELMKQHEGNLVHVAAHYNFGHLECGDDPNCRPTIWQLRTNCGYVDTFIAAHNSAIDQGYDAGMPEVETKPATNKYLMVGAAVVAFGGTSVWLQRRSKTRRS